MTKTVKEWLEELPYGMRQEALKMCNCPDMQMDSLSSAISVAFYWRDSPSGVSYWSGVHDGLRAVGK